jgi:hypothetical protein
VDENGAMGTLSQLVKVNPVIPNTSSENEVIAIITQTLQSKITGGARCQEYASFIYSLADLITELPDQSFQCTSDSDCNGNGQCQNGMCMCYSNYVGGDCSLTVAQLIQRRKTRNMLMLYYLGCVYSPDSSRRRHQNGNFEADGESVTSQSLSQHLSVISTIIGTYLEVSNDSPDIITPFFADLINAAAAANIQWFDVFTVDAVQIIGVVLDSMFTSGNVNSISLSRIRTIIIPQLLSLTLGSKIVNEHPTVVVIRGFSLLAQSLAIRPTPNVSYNVGRSSIILPSSLFQQKYNNQSSGSNSLSVQVATHSYNLFDTTALISNIVSLTLAGSTVIDPMILNISGTYSPTLEQYSCKQWNEATSQWEDASQCSISSVTENSATCACKAWAGNFMVGTVNVVPTKEPTNIIGPLLGGIAGSIIIVTMMTIIFVISFYRIRAKNEKPREEPLSENPVGIAVAIDALEPIELQTAGTELEESIYGFIADTRPHQPSVPFAFDEESLSSSSSGNSVTKLMINTTPHRLPLHVSFDVESIDSSLQSPFDEESLSSNNGSVIVRSVFDEESLTSNCSPHPILYMIKDSTLHTVRERTFDEETLTSVAKDGYTERDIGFVPSITEASFAEDDGCFSDTDWDNDIISVIFEIDQDDETIRVHIV